MICLASTSLSRQKILLNAGLEFTSEVPRVDEQALKDMHPQWSPVDVAIELAIAKAVEVSQRNTMSLVVGADQVLELDGRVFSKPASQSECRHHLMDLRGKQHKLISGVAVAYAGDVLWKHCDTAQLKMRNFSDDFLEEYLSRIGNDCLSSVGGYKIEGLGIQLFDRVDGDYFTIIGLPLIPLLTYIRSRKEISS